MSENTAKLCKCCSIALTVVNGFLLLAVCRQLHLVSLHHGSSPVAMPSLLIVLLAVVMFALLIGKEWLRPAWLPLVLNIAWLVASALPLLKLTALLT
ncbi:MAG: hypothetical protein NTY53_09750 [Kiritimatiellaeota bacterium]|nr:hypothetical protein [Kiritimatiellota bacterium]